MNSGFSIDRDTKMAVSLSPSRHYIKEQADMHLLWSLWFFVAYFDIDVKCKHIAGITNSTADHLSHGNLHLFFSLHPQVTLQPSPLPQPLLQILEAGGPDWILPLFRQPFSTILRMV